MNRNKYECAECGGLDDEHYPGCRLGPEDRDIPDDDPEVDIEN